MGAPQNPDTHVDMGSQRARQGQHVRGMRKVLIFGTLLTVLGFAVLFLIWASWESSDPSPQADLRSESNAAVSLEQPATRPPPTPDPGAVGSAPGTVPLPPGGQPGTDDARDGTPGQ